MWYLQDFSRAPRGSRQIWTREVVPTLSLFVWYLQDFSRAPRGSRQILTGKCCSYPFRFCVVFAGHVHGAKGIPANFDPQMLFLPFPVLCGICRTSAGCHARGSRQILTGKFCSYPFRFCVVFAGHVHGAKGITTKEKPHFVNLIFWF